MKKNLYYCTVIAIIQAHFVFASSPPKTEFSPIQVRMVIEDNPGSKTFFDNEIEKALKLLYSQNGCNSMNQMAQFHGPETLMSYYQVACQNALREFYAIRNREQALKAAEYANW